MSETASIEHIPIEQLRAATRAWREAVMRPVGLFGRSPYNPTTFDRMDELVEEIARLRGIVEEIRSPSQPERTTE